MFRNAVLSLPMALWLLALAGFGVSQSLGMQEKYYVVYWIATSAAVAVVAIIVQIRMSALSRGTAAVLHMQKELYGDLDFSSKRIRLWRKLAELSTDPDLKWNYRVWIDSLFSGKEVCDIDEITVLNKVVAFYHQLRHLMEIGEIDRDLASKFFYVNYSFWNRYRVKFYNDTLEQQLKDSFKALDIVRLEETPE